MISFENHVSMKDMIQPFECFESLEQSFPRGWVKFEIKTNIMGKSMLPDMYFLINLGSAGVLLAISNSLVVSLQPLTRYDFEFHPNSWKTLNICR